MQSEVNIWSLVKSLLHRNNCVIVPNLGGFLAHQQSATIDPLSLLITPPSKHITFNVQLTLNDGLLATKIADYLKISYSDAIKIIDVEISNFHQTLKNNSQYHIEGLGNFELTESKNLVFSPDKNANFLTNSFGLESVRFSFVGQLKTAKIIHKTNVVNGPNLPDLAAINDESDETSGEIIPNTKRVKRRRNNLAFSLIGTVLFLVLGLNAYIFLQEGNLTPVRNKFNELDLGLKISSLTSVFNIDNNDAALPINAEDLLKIYTANNITKEFGFKTEIFENNNHVDQIDTTNVLVELSNEIQQPIQAQENAVVEASSKEQIGRAYHIIAGAFKSKNKASKLLNELYNDGFPNAKIIQNPSASAKKLKYFVSYNNFSLLNETTSELEKINEYENPDAWIFEVK